MMKFQNVFFLVLLGAFLFMAFIPKESPVDSNLLTKRINERDGFNSDECLKFSDLSEAESDQVSDNYSVYRDRIKENNFQEAYPLWKDVYQKAPKTNGRIDYVFRDGIKIYTAFHKATTDSILQQKYVDTMIMIYGKAVVCFPEKKSYYLSKQGVDMFYKYRGSMNDKEIYGQLKTAISLDKEAAKVSSIIPLSSLNFRLYADEKISREDARTTLDNINGIVKMNIENCEDEKNCNAWTQVEQYTLELNNRFENQNGFYDCDFFMEKYYAEFEAAPNDCELIEELYRRLKKANCATDNSKMVKLVDTFKGNCMKPTTDPDLACGRENMENEDYKEAIKCYQRYVNNTENVDAKANFNLRIAKIYFLYIRNFPKARVYARTAAELKPNWGDPYILIGKLYAGSGSLCGPGTGFESQVVTWAAIDKWNEAKRIDPNTVDQANKLINIYSKYMPSKEDVFSRPKINEGEAYQVKCWIKEKTIVRVVK
jgi:tetratricopeptide (TPR) repeat protein